MPDPTPREILDRVDSLRRTANAAEHMRVRIRLLERPVLRRGLLGFRKREQWHADLELNADETFAVYQALADVRDRAQREADALEQTLTVEDR